MYKYPPKRLDNQSNRRTIFRVQVIVKHPKKPRQQSVLNTEATKVNSIMEQLDDLDENGYGRNTNINHFVLLF